MALEIIQKITKIIKNKGSEVAHAIVDEWFKNCGKDDLGPELEALIKEYVTEEGVRIKKAGAKAMLGLYQLVLRDGKEAGIKALAATNHSKGLIKAASASFDIVLEKAKSTPASEMDKMLKTMAGVEED